MPSATMRPLRNSGAAAVCETMAKSRSPLTRSLVKAPALRYGTWTMDRPARCLSSSPAKCSVEPTPGLP